MKHPFRSNLSCIEPTTDPNKFLVRDFCNDIIAVASEEEIHYSSLFDGKTDPFSIFPNKKKIEVLRIIRNLEKKGLIRKNRIFYKRFPKILFSLVLIYNPPVLDETSPKKEQKTQSLCFILNNIIMLSFIPLLVFSILFKGPVYKEVSYPDWLYLCRIPITVLVYAVCVTINMVVHEACHAISNIGYGGKVFEFGYVFPLPSCYTLMNPNKIKGRLRRVQVYLAGIEGNIICGSIAYLISKLANIPLFHTLFIYCFSISLSYAIVNSVFCWNLDGKKAIKTILGMPEGEGYLSIMKKLLKKAKNTQSDPKERMNAKVSVLATGILMSFSLVLFISLIAIELTSIVSVLLDPSFLF